MNSFPLHVGDYIRDTVGLSMLEDGAYNRLLHQYYASEKPLPLDRALVYRMARASSPEERAAVDYVVTTYFKETDSGWISKRAEEELAKIRERSEQARQAGLASGKARQQMMNNRSTDVRDELAFRSTSQNPIASNQNPESNNQEPIPKNQEPESKGLAPKRTRFEPPSAEEVEAEFERLGFGARRLGVKFVAHYEAAGWKLKGGNPMRSWKAAVVTWAENQSARSNGDGSNLNGSGMTRTQRVLAEMKAEGRIK